MAEIMNLSEIKGLAPGTKFLGLGAVTSVSEKKDKNGKSYWIVGIMDKTGMLEARVWSNASWVDKRDDVAKEIPADNISEWASNLKGLTIGVKGEVSDFRGKTQFAFNQLVIVNQDKEEYRPENFVQKADIQFDDLEKKFDYLLEQCQGEVGDFLRFVFAKDGPVWDSFKVIPAAVTHHHAYVHGLLEHTVGVAYSAYAMGKSYENTHVAPDINFVIAGAYLHDLGKLDTYVLNPTPGMTLEGTIIDHIPMGYVRFCNLADQFGLSPLARNMLGHIMLSHHGLKEYGSPVLPATVEAMIISAADNLDFQLNCWLNAVENLDGGEKPENSISDFDFSTQRRFWKWKED